MGQNSAIEWTEHTFNPWWGCVRVSPGCQNCYAELLAKRYGHDVWGKQVGRRFLSENHWKQPISWNRQATQEGRRHRVFCASMADVFEDSPTLTEPREKLWELIDKTSMLDWLLLTKRPENMLRLAPWQHQWPQNVWAMTTVENQEYANKRIPLLLEVPAVVRALSVEPLIGRIDISKWLGKIDWVIVGGESGGKARPPQPEWVRWLRDQCLEASVPFFFKQWGSWKPSDKDQLSVTPMQRASKKNAGRTLDGRQWNQIPRQPALTFAGD